MQAVAVASATAVQSGLASIEISCQSVVAGFELAAHDAVLSVVKPLWRAWSMQRLETPSCPDEEKT